jgi:hypothetical protein
MGVRFPAKWCGLDLGHYRACDGGYHNYSVDTLPPLDESRFTGRFEWLGDQGLAIARARPSFVRCTIELGGGELPLRGRPCLPTSIAPNRLFRRYQAAAIFDLPAVLRQDLGPNRI